jgi:hypothetical protein
MLLVLIASILIDHIRAQSIPSLPCPSSCHDSRTIWSIVWSSLVTLFACIWVAVHPNVPAFTDGTLAKVKQRAKLLLTAIIAPEFIIMFAMRQWVCARIVMQSAFGRGKGFICFFRVEQIIFLSEERGWTQTHGFFVIMGGFELYDSDGERPLYPLDFENIEKLVQSGAIDFPKIAEKDIEDRSKGDIISKGLAVIQTGWFIAQCIARGAEHLAITELEIMTVAFAFLNLVTYIFWWNKPLNVTCPIRIVLKEGHNAAGPSFLQRASLWDRLGRIFYLISPDRDGDLEVDMLREKRVPTFYAGRIIESTRSWYALLVAEILIAMIFGGIHCIAWSFSFPTHVEQILWRACSIAITSIPVLWAGAIVFLYFRLEPVGIFIGIIATFFSFVYPFARLILLILSFISLRLLPASAFYTVRWTTFIPHVG